MKLLVTGGAGFIGSNFIIYWLKKYPDDKIINLDKLTYAGNLDNLKQIEQNRNYLFVKGDICNYQFVNTLAKDVDLIVHFAAESHVDRSIYDPAIFVKTNVIGTYNLLDACLNNKIKQFHHVSTDEVYGSLKLGDKNKFSEDSPYKPSSPYAATKAASDHLVRAYQATYGLKITITNCTNNYGPYQHPEKLIPLTITNLIENREVPVYGDGLYVRDWLYVEDHCRAIDLVVKNGQSGKTYCVGGLTDDVTNLEIVKKIVKILGKSESLIKFVQDRPGHDRKYAVNWHKIKKELGFTPAFDLDTYLAKTVNWYKDNRKWWQKLKNKTWQNYYQNQYNDL